MASQKEKIEPIKRKRVTFALPESVDNLLEMYCNSFHIQKNDAAEKALTDYLSFHKEEVEIALRKARTDMDRLIPKK